jgi:hypothetical protein
MLICATATLTRLTGFDGYDEEQNYLFYYQQDIGGSLGTPLAFRRQKTAQIRTNLFGSYEEMHVQQRTAPLVQLCSQRISNLPRPCPGPNCIPGITARDLWSGAFFV